MAKVTEHIAQSKGQALFTIEIIPPVRGTKIEHLLNDIEPLMELKPKFVDVTYHREEYIFEKQNDGSEVVTKTRKRPGTVGVCAALMHKYDTDPVPHVLCGGFTKDETEDLLIDLDYLGIENVMALRGDHAKPFKTFKAKKGGNNYASDLIAQINDMNQGKYLHESTDYLNATDFCIGAAVYPEKHFEAKTLEEDIKYAKMKVDAGAEYLVTQMFFDNQKYFDFVDKCRAEGIDVPIIPGIKILTTKRQLDILPEIFYLSIPEDLRKAAAACKTNQDVRQVGIDWCVNQCNELKEYGVPALHFYTMSKSSATLAVAKQVF